MGIGRERLELFGSDSQIKLQQRYYRLWPYLKAHPRISFVGRALGVDDPSLDEVDQLAGLAMELGFLSLAFTRPAVAQELAAELQAHGLEVGFWQHLLSNEQTASNSRAVAASRHLPPGYKIARIDAATPPEQIVGCQELMQTCGVAPLPGYILRGQEVPAIAEVLINSRHRIVATGVSIFRHNPTGRYAKAAHVGFLATEPAERGQGFAQLLLARINLASIEERGASLLHTGVRAANEVSQHVCRQCGLEDSGRFFLGVVYPPVLQREAFTR